jgi:hypothetical protein
MGVGLRNIVGRLQGSIRVLTAINKTKRYRKYGDVLPKYKIKKQLELRKQILDHIEFLTRSWKLCDQPRSQAFHQKILADHYRYAYECLDL